MKIYLTRHSKTLWNNEKRLQGHKDSPLTKEGIDNALALKDYLKDYTFDYIYSSPIKRAYDTTKLLFPNIDIIKDNRLMEMNFGELEGLKIDNLPLKYEEAYHLLWNKPHLSNGLPGGESYDEIENRVSSFLDEITKLDANNIIIVTHGFIFTIIASKMLNLERKDYIKVNKEVVNGCSLTCFTYNDGKFTLDFYGDNHFLPHKSKEIFAK